MNKFYLYIGSNNITKVLEIEKAIEIISGYFEGFTAYEVVGYWKGHKEKTLKVEIVAEAGEVMITKLCKDLAEKLDQEAILLEKINSNMVFIQK